MIVISLALGVLTLISLGLWAVWTRRQTGRPRVTMWFALAVRVLSALSALPAFFLDEVPTGAKVLAGFVVVLTIVGVLMVRGELVSSTARTESGARQS